MNYIYLISIIIGASMQNVLKKAFTQKTDGGGYYFFGALSSLAAMLFFVVTSKEFEWNPGFVVYSVGFALSYGAATVFSKVAIENVERAIRTARSRANVFFIGFFLRSFVCVSADTEFFLIIKQKTFFVNVFFCTLPITEKNRPPFSERSDFNIFLKAEIQLLLL